MDTLATASNVLQVGNEPPASTGLLLSLQDVKGGLLNTPKKWKRKLCCLNACRKVTVPANRRVSYFKVRTEWYKIIREARKEPRWIAQTADVRLCSLHFTDDQFKILDKIYVKEKALPTEYLTCDDHDHDDENPSTSSTQSNQQTLVASVGANQKPINPKYIDMSFIHSRNNYNNNNKTNFGGMKSRIKSTPQQKRISLIKTEMMKSAAKTITLNNNHNNTTTTTSTHTTTPTNTVIISNNNKNNSSISTTNLNLTEAFILPDQVHILDQNQHQFLIQQQPHQVFIINNSNLQNNGQEILQQEQHQQQESFDVLLQDSTPTTSNTTNIPETTTLSNLDSSSSDTVINNFTISTPTTTNVNDNNDNLTTTTMTTTTTTNTTNTKTTTLENGECKEISSNSIVLVNLKRPGLASKFYNSKRNKNNNNPPSLSSSFRRITNTTNCAQSFSRIAASFRANKMINSSSSDSTNINNDNINIHNNSSFQDPLAVVSQPGTSNSSSSNIVNNTYHHITHMKKSRAASPTRKIEKLKQVNATLRTKVYQKTRQITRLDKRITNLKKQNKDLEDQLSLDEIEIASVNALKENPIMKTIIETEIQRQKLKKACTKGMRYTDEMKRLAVTIFKLSLPTYKFLRKAFAMPEESSIREWISGQDVSGTNVQNIIQDISLTRKPRQMLDIQDPSSASHMLAPSTVTTTIIPETVITTTVDSSNTIINNFTMPVPSTTNNDVLDVEGIVVHEFEIQHDDETVHDVGNNVSVVVMQDPHNIVHDYEQNLDLQQVEMEVDGNTVTEVSVTDMSELLLLSQ